MGLVLILMILKPLSDYLSAGIELEDIMPQQQQAGIVDKDAEDYIAIQDNMLRQSINRQAEAQIEGYCEKDGFKLISADVKTDADFSSLQALYLSVKRTGAKSRPFIYIEPPDSEEAPEIKRLKNTLSEVYNMSPDNIHITEIE